MTSTSEQKGRKRKFILSLAVVAGMIAAIGIGTMASFTAQTKNPDNVFAAGTLVLSNTKQSGSACLSTGGGSTDTNANDSCDTLFNLTVRKPGDTGSANLTLKNEGSLNASVFKIFSAACANADAAGEDYHGTGDPCSKIQLTVQEYSDSGFTTPSACLYGGAVGATCDFSDATKTLGAFQTSHSSSTNGLSLAGIDAGESKYYSVGVKLPSDADNTFQGRQSTMDFTWYAAE